MTLLAVGGCAPQEMTAQVGRWVPSGTSFADAQRIMEQHGFTCSAVAPDCLLCDLTESSSFPFKVYNYHHAYLTFYASGGLSAVQMDTAFKGP